jgi:microcystin-dependent protein
MSNPPNNYNTNTAFNKFKGTYFNNDIDLSGGNIISRTGNLYLAPNSSIFTENNQILFNEEFQFIDFVNNVNVLGQLKNTYNSIVYDVGLQCEKTDNLIDDVATLSPIVSDTAFKCTNFYYDQASNSTVWSGLLTCPISSIASTAIANTTRFIEGTGNQTIAGNKQFNAVTRFLSNIRCDAGLTVNNNTLTITNAQLQLIPSIGTLNTKTTNILYSSLTNQTQISNLLEFTGTLNGFSVTNFNNAITQSLGLTSPAQTQLTTNANNISTATTNITTLTNKLTNVTFTTPTTFITGTTETDVLKFNTSLNGITPTTFSYLSDVTSAVGGNLTSLQNQITNISSVSLSANNIFTGLCQFTNNLQLNSSLGITTPTTSVTLSNDNLTRIQYLSNITTDIKASLDTLTDKMSGFYRSETGTYWFDSNLNTNGKFNTLTSYEIGNLTATTEPLQIAINALKTKTDTTNINLATTTTNANDALQRTQEISFSATPTPQTNITSKCVTEELVFTTDLNDITPTTFGYLSGVTSSIQTQLNSKIDSIAGSIIQHISANLQTNFPTKYLLCNGQSVSRTTYANLFSYIGTTYGSVDGNSFSVPDFTACFLRMASGTRTVGGVSYTPNAVGTIQQDSLEAHVHSSNLTGSYLNDSTKSGTFFSFGTFRYNATNFPSFGGGVSSSHRTSTETKPLNHSVYFYITC